eukprot:scaffold2045_cov62-Cylindrotheca_fusiformis.AAC.2
MVLHYTSPSPPVARKVHTTIPSTTHVPTPSVVWQRSRILFHNVIGKVNISFLQSGRVMIFNDANTSASNRPIFIAAVLPQDSSLLYGSIGTSHSKVNSTLDRYYARSLPIPAPSILPLVRLLSVLFHFNIQQFKTCRRGRSTRGMHS